MHRRRPRARRSHRRWSRDILQHDMRSVAAGGAPNPPARVGTGTREIKAADRRSVARELRNGAAVERLVGAHVHVRDLPARETKVAFEILRRLWDREPYRGRKIRSKK